MGPIFIQSGIRTIRIAKEYNIPYQLETTAFQPERMRAIRDTWRYSYRFGLYTTALYAYFRGAFDLEDINRLAVYWLIS